MSCFRSRTARDGTNQRQRFVFDLNPDNLKIADQDVEGFTAFLSRFAELINYYNPNNQIEGDWTPFFTDVELASATGLLTKRFLNTIPDESKPTITPHVSLLLVFFKLFQYLQNDLNGFTRRHLEYYFQEFLGFKLRTGSPSNAFLLFELSRTATPLVLETGTRFRAGKNATGADQFYKLEKDVLLNKASLAGVKLIFVHKEIIHPSTTLDPHRIFVSHQADSADGLGAPLEKPENGWKPFGENQSNTTVAPAMQPAEIGFAISSPVLFMKEGHREIVIQMECKDLEPVTLRTSDLTDTISVYYSSAKGWTPSVVTATVIVVGKVCSIRINCVITADKPAVEKFPEPPDALPFDSPAMKIAFDVSSGSSPYSKLQSLEVESISIFTRVKGIKGVSLFNEQGILDPSKPFLPFGSAPTVGSKLYIGSSEIFSKKLTNLTTNITWKGLPDGGLGKYYKSYFKKTALGSPPWLENSDAAPFLNEDYTADLDLLQEGQVLPLLTNFPLFNNPPDDKKPVIIQDVYSATLHRTKVNMDLEELPPVSQALAGGYMVLTFRGLTYDSQYQGITSFGHAEFPSTFSDIAIGKAKPGSTIYNNIALPNPPYTPLVQSMEINYEAKAEIKIGEKNQYDKFFHLEPFGINHPEQSSATIPVLPQFTDEGYLYIGLQDLLPSQFISMLFQLIEGSGNPDIPLERGDIKWAYLAGNKWIALAPVEVVGENTQGFQKTGIVELSLGRDISIDHTLLPPGISWIRASVAEKADGACRVQKIFTQAALATYDLLTEGDSSQLHDFPVAAEIISRLEVSNAGIKKIAQPLPSFSGGPAELQQAFYTRVSERLRHRRRAINTWDYEHVILQAFPDIYKVKCIPHWKGVESNFPGWVTVVLIPFPYNKNGEIRLEPKNSVTALRSVQDYLREIIPSPVDVLAVNPLYERIFLDFKVSFLPGLDGGYFGQLLNEELKQLLSPWAFDQQQDITFGGSVFKSDVINFIENREYVDFITDFSLYSSVEIPDGCPGLEEMRIIDFPGAPERIDDFTILDLPTPGLEEMILEQTFIVGQPLTLAIASTPLSVIVSSPKHRIHVLRPNESACSGLDLFGLGSMILEIDFEITNA